jgi:hypothetical protein
MYLKSISLASPTSIKEHVDHRFTVVHPQIRADIFLNDKKTSHIRRLWDFIASETSNVHSFLLLTTAMKRTPV